MNKLFVLGIASTFSVAALAAEPGIKRFVDIKTHQSWVWHVASNHLIDSHGQLITPIKAQYDSSKKTLKAWASFQSSPMMLKASPLPLNTAKPLCATLAQFDWDGSDPQNPEQYTAQKTNYSEKEQQLIEYMIHKGAACPDCYNTYAWLPVYYCLDDTKVVRWMATMFEKSKYNALASNVKIAYLDSAVFAFTDKNITILDPNTGLSKTESPLVIVPLYYAEMAPVTQQKVAALLKAAHNYTVLQQDMERAQQSLAYEIDSWNTALTEENK